MSIVCFFLKVRIILGLQNDHKAIMKRIEDGLCKVHSEFRGSSNTGSQQATSASYTNGHAMNDINRPVTEDRCFAIVGSVHDGSPADLAVSIYLTRTWKMFCFKSK